MKKLVIVRSEDLMFLVGFMMDQNTQPKAIWSEECTLTWDESDFALVCMLSVGINTTECDISYCEVMDADVTNPENN